MSDDYLTEEEAARLWQRAAQLQAESQARADALSAEKEEEEATTSLTRTDGYAIDHVRAAALEAGIGAEYLDAALADLRVSRTLSEGTPAERGFSSRFLGDPPESARAVREIEATVTSVLRAMEEVLPADPYSLALVERVGEAEEGGVLIFRPDGAATTEPFAATMSAAGLKRLVFRVRQLHATDGPRCELVVEGPLSQTWRLNAGLGTGFSGLTGAVGLGIGWKAGVFVAGALVAAGVATWPVAGAAAGVVTAASTGGGGGLGVWAYRATYRYTIRKAEEAFEGMLAAVALRAEGGWRLAPGSPEELSP